MERRDDPDAELHTRLGQIKINMTKKLTSQFEATSLRADQDLGGACTAEWASYSFYHDRFDPFFFSDNDLYYVIGLFSDGTCSRIFVLPAVEQSDVVRVVNPFDIVAIARVRLPISGLQHLSFDGRRSYVLIERPAFTREAESYALQQPQLFGLNDAFDPEMDRGEFLLCQDQIARMLTTLDSDIYGEPFLFTDDGLLKFLDRGIYSDDLTGVDCYAAQGIIGESRRHIFVGVTKRSWADSTLKCNRGVGGV